MNEYIVLYRTARLGILDSPLYFLCKAKNDAQAVDMCEEISPGCDVVWVFEGNNVDDAFKDYYG